MQNRKIYKGVLIKKQITIKIRKNTKEAKCHWQARPTNIVSYLKARHAWFFFFYGSNDTLFALFFFYPFFLLDNRLSNVENDMSSPSIFSGHNR
jgi:hypothetical protein